MTTSCPLDQHLHAWAKGDTDRETVSLLIEQITTAGIRLAQTIARYDLVEDGQITLQDDLADADRIPLLQTAHRIFEVAMRALPVSVFASSEREAPRRIDPDGRFAVVIDPLDGSSNIDTNLSIGSLFSIIESDGHDLVDIVPGGRVKAAGFLFYGPQIRLVLSHGEGCYQFLLDPASECFFRIGDAIRIPPGRCEFAINTSNYRYWESSVRHFIDDCVAGEDGAFGENFNMRWNASLVAEAFRILTRGGVFLYPGDSRPEYRDGRLRLLFEALPLAMLIEQAGGSASDGCQRILEVRLPALHARTPLIFGCCERVLEVIDYVSGDALDSGRFPLFANRSLLRS